MKAKFINPLLAVTITALSIIAGCKDIIETDLTEERINIIVPSNNLHTNLLAHTFSWDKVDQAIKYHFQMISPDFSNAEILVADSNLTGTKIQLTLSPGTYQWRVKAFNNSSSTNYVTYTLTIDSTALVSPANNYATTTQKILFHWYKLYNADDYRFEIRNPDWAGGLVINPQITQHDTITFTLDEGVYEWGVQGHNAVSNSSFVTRKLYIDLTAPSLPVLLYPSVNASIQDSVLSNSTLIFTWQRETTNGSPVKDSLYLASDSLFTPTGIKTTAYLTDTSFSYVMTTSGTYYWKIRSIDAAGNKSAYTSTRRFTYVKP